MTFSEFLAQNRVSLHKNNESNSISLMYLYTVVVHEYQRKTIISWTKKIFSVSKFVLFIYLFICNWDSLHERLSNHYKACSYKKKKYKKIKAYRKSLYKENTG